MRHQYVLYIRLNVNVGIVGATGGAWSTAVDYYII